MRAVASAEAVTIRRASSDHTARLWRAAPETMTTVLTGHTAELNGAGFSPDGMRVVTASGQVDCRGGLQSIGLPTYAVKLRSDLRTNPLICL